MIRRLLAGERGEAMLRILFSATAPSLIALLAFALAGCNGASQYGWSQYGWGQYAYSQHSAPS